MTPHDEHRNSMLAAVDDLYTAFANYRVRKLEGLSCYDFGPTDAELAAVRDHALREVPKRALQSMEFYAYGWESWGSEEEVKHFLPRLLQLISEDPSMLNGGPSSLFKYKLCGALQPTRLAPRPGVRWPDAERQALAAWADAVLPFHLHRTRDVFGLIEAVLEMGMRSEQIIRTWSGVSREMRSAQIDAEWKPTYAEDEDVCAEAAKVAEWVGTCDAS